MIALLLVSHSATLAQGVLELVLQMTQGRVPIATAGGTEIPEAPMGTDPQRVLRALEGLFTQPDVAAVVVLMDLGSAIMSTEMALEWLTEERRQQVHLSPAPLVEGALAAAVCAGLGGSVAEVLRDALAGHQNKITATTEPEPQRPHAPGSPLDPPPDPPPDWQTDWQPDPQSAPAIPALPTGTPPLAPDEPLVHGELRVRNALGVHARPAARILRILAERRAQLTLTHRGRTRRVGGLNDLLSLAIRQGDTLHLQVRGPDAAIVCAELHALAQAHFGDPPLPASPSGTQPTDVSPQADDLASLHQEGGRPAVRDPAALQVPERLHGQPTVSGIALAPPFVPPTSRPTLPGAPTADAESVPAALPSLDPLHESARLQAARQIVLQQLAQLRQARQQAGDTPGADILEAQWWMLEDPQWLASAVAHLHAAPPPGLDAATAWERALHTTLQTYQDLPEGYFAQRGDDLADVGQRVLQELRGETDTTWDFPSIPFILVVQELSPSMVLRLSTTPVCGILAGTGGTQGHAAILARSYGIPTIMGLGESWQQAAQASELGLDGQEGTVWIHPQGQARAALLERHAAWRQRQDRLRQQALAPARLATGERIVLHANIGTPEEVLPALANGAEGIGLLRSEWLFMQHRHAPDEEEQYVCYRQIARDLAGQPLVIRSFDFGGDKPLAFAPMDAEPNPFLGLRGLRYALCHPELFRPQLRAILRVAAEHPVHLLLPMVSTPHEVRSARVWLEQVRIELSAGRTQPMPPLPLGIMLETPAAVWSLSSLAGQVDFFSIGSNDLTQYLMAADRGNPAVAALTHDLPLPLLRALQEIVQVARATGTPVSLCGELASDLTLLPVLIGLGLERFSVSAAHIPAVKDRLHHLSREEAVRLAQQALAQAEA